VIRREDTQQTALSLNEFIEKRGDDKWADEIVEAVGPWLMVQLSDMANFFESMRNFYEWRKPTRTAYTLGALGVVIIACALTPTWFLIKASTLSMGFSFFALFPIATNYPEYRLLLSPTKRILWNIPTHAEWAVQYIQAEGTRVATTTPDNITKPMAIPIKTTPDGAQSQGPSDHWRRVVSLRVEHWAQFASACCVRPDREAGEAGSCRDEEDSVAAQD
jgi:hypothetical protein